MRLLWFCAGGLTGSGLTAIPLLWLDPGGPAAVPGQPTRADLRRVEERAAYADRRASRAAVEVCELLAELARLDAANRDLRVRLDAATRGQLGLGGVVLPADLIPPTNLPEK